MMRGLLAALAMVALLAGCVTESSGGFPAPAERDVRVNAHLDLARGYLGQRDWKRARDPLQRALDIDPRSAEALMLMGVLYQNEGEPELAEQHYRAALRSDPQHPQALNNFGSFLYAQGRHGEALAPLRRLVKNPTYRARAQAYENLGLAELATGNVDTARESFSRSLSLNAAQPRSLLELADLSFQDGDYREALGYYDGFKALARQSPRSLCLGLRLAARIGDDSQRDSYAIALRNLYPNSDQARDCGSEGGS